MGKEGGPSEKEMGLKPEETRILSDAELIKGGARKDEGGRLEVTKVQIAKAKAEMDVALAEAESRAEEMRNTYPELAKNLDRNVSEAKAVISSLELKMDETKTDGERRAIQRDLNIEGDALKRALETRDVFLKGV